MGNITGEMLLSQGKDVAPYFMVDDMGLIQGHVGIFLFLVCISLKRAYPLNVLDVNILLRFITPKETITSDAI